MAIKYVIWDKKRDLYPLVGGKLTAQQVFERWGWTERPDSVVLITEQGGTLCSLDNLEILKHNCGITLTDPLEAIAELERVQSLSAEARVEELREEGREEIRKIVREEVAKGRIDGPALNGLRKCGVLTP